MENLQRKIAVSGRVIKAWALKMVLFSWAPVSQLASSMYLLATYADIHKDFRNLKGTDLLKQQHVMEGY